MGIATPVPGRALMGAGVPVGAAAVAGDIIKTAVVQGCSGPEKRCCVWLVLCTV